jgi:hypothetical protein
MARETDAYFRYSVRNDITDKPFDNYSCITITVSGVVDYDLSNNTALFENLSTANELLFIVGISPVTVKLDAVDHDPIPIDANAKLGLSSIAVENVFLTCSESTSLTIYAAGWK